MESRKTDNVDRRVSEAARERAEISVQQEEALTLLRARVEKELACLQASDVHERVDAVMSPNKPHGTVIAGKDF